jgi:hypothetical protein
MFRPCSIAVEKSACSIPCTATRAKRLVPISSIPAKNGISIFMLIHQICFPLDPSQGKACPKFCRCSNAGESTRNQEFLASAIGSAEVVKEGKRRVFGASRTLAWYEKVSIVIGKDTAAYTNRTSMEMKHMHLYALGDRRLRRMLIVLACRNVQKLAGFNAAQPVLLHQYFRGIFQAVLTQSLPRLGRDTFPREKHRHQ